MTRQVAKVAYLTPRETRIVANELDALGFTYTAAELAEIGYVGNLTDRLRAQGETDAANRVEDLFDPESSEYIRGITDIAPPSMPCSEYRPHPDLRGLDGTPFCVCGFERRQH